jgi:hypothetical protein
LPEKWDDPSPKMESSISYSNWKYIIPDSVYKIQLVTVMKSPIYGYGYKSVFLINDTYYLKRDTEDKKKLEKIFARDSLAKVYFNKAKQGDSQKVFGFIMIAGGAAVGYAISKSDPNYAIAGAPLMLGGLLAIGQGNKKYGKYLNMACNAFSHLPMSYSPTKSYYGYQTIVWENAYQHHVSVNKQILRF